MWWVALAFVSVLASAHTNAAWAADAGADFPASVRIASILVNGLVRVAAIAAGTYVVWLGHNTLIRGIKGEFEYSGRLGKLKGSAPGLLFVFLGCLAIGWALAAEHSGRLTSAPQTQGASPLGGTSVPPPTPRP